jgi:ATP-dependent Lhr-like helicase
MLETLAIDTPAPSPMAHEILNANPYAFLDDAPLEERRARAVSLRRVDPRLAQEFGRLDPAAIDEVRRQAWPEVRSPDELHDLLLGVGLLPQNFRPDWQPLADALIKAKRATLARWREQDSEHDAYIPAERADLIRLAIPGVSFAPPIELPLGFAEKVESAEDAHKKIVQGWLEVSGPISANELAKRLGLPAPKIEAALIALESAGVVLRGQFSGESLPEGETEWCDRVLLARIHRLTLGRMRKEIEPVSAADFMRFQLAWQHVAAGSKLAGREGVLQVIRRLQALEVPAPAWERHILPARIDRYDPHDLEHLCLAGVLAWGRVKPGSAMNGDDCQQGSGPTRRNRRILAPARNAPISFLVREDIDAFLEMPTLRFDQIPTLSAMAQDVARYLDRHGASFLNDIARGTGILRVKVEEALWQLVAHGLATGDGIAGLRVLLTPKKKRGERRLHVVSGGRSAERSMPVGRWSLWRPGFADEPLSGEAKLERRARQLLERYGIVVRELLARETMAPPWRSLLHIYRRLEARGEIRGGRFINGFVGEQFALPQALDQLREMKRKGNDGETIMISAADPLNLVGIIVPGPRVSPYSNQVIAYRDGVPVDIGLRGELVSRLQSLPSQTRL